MKKTILLTGPYLVGSNVIAYVYHKNNKLIIYHLDTTKYIVDPECYYLFANEINANKLIFGTVVSINDNIISLDRINWYMPDIIKTELDVPHFLINVIDCNVSVMICNNKIYGKPSITVTNSITRETYFGIIYSTKYDKQNNCSVKVIPFSSSKEWYDIKNNNIVYSDFSSDSSEEENGEEELLGESISDVDERWASYLASLQTEKHYVMNKNILKPSQISTYKEKEFEKYQEEELHELEDTMDETDCIIL